MNKEESLAFWGRAKEQLKMSNLSLKSYAAVAGVSVHTVYNQIQTGVLPDVEAFLLLARMTNSDPYWLLWGDSPRAEIKNILAAYAETNPAIAQNDIASLEKQMQNLINKLKEKQ